MSFYVQDQDVVDELARFVADGLLQEGRAVVVATSQHRKALVETLRAMGLDPDEPPVAGHLVLLDATADPPIVHDRRPGSTGTASWPGSDSA